MNTIFMIYALGVAPTWAYAAMCLIRSDLAKPPYLRNGFSSCYTSGFILGMFWLVVVPGYLLHVLFDDE